MSWCTIESDPGVFSELIQMLGVKDVSVEEIYSLDQHASEKNVSYGLIFLFKWRQETDDREVFDPTILPELFFSKQIVNNACATQAILSVLLNAENINLGDDLNEFKAFGSMLDAESKGIAIGNSDKIRVAHNSFAKPEPFINEESKLNIGDKEDVYHFIAYIPFRGSVYEIDGLKSGPIYIGDAGDNWLAVARPAIEERMSRYSSTETHFALLSVRQKKSTALESEISTLEAIQNSFRDSGNRVSNEEEDQVRNELLLLRSQLEDELLNQEKQRQENIRRRHNYIPFIIALLRSLAEKDKLVPMVEKAKSNTKSNRK